jgi:hypothetical protein
MITHIKTVAVCVEDQYRVLEFWRDKNGRDASTKLSMTTLRPFAPLWVNDQRWLRLCG